MGVDAQRLNFSKHGRRVASAMSLVCSCLLAGGITGCGYQFQGSGTILPADIRKVAIPAVENETTESRLGERMTEELRSQFERYGVVTIVEDPSSADAVLKVKVTKVDTKTRNVTSSQKDPVPNVAVDQDLVMTVSAELRRKTGQLLYKNSNLTVSESFAGISSVVVTGSSSFAQGGLSAGSLTTLGQQASSVAVAQGQQSEVLDDLVEEASRRLYLESVAADF